MFVCAQVSWRRRELMRIAAAPPSTRVRRGRSEEPPSPPNTVAANKRRRLAAVSPRQRDLNEYWERYSLGFKAKGGSGKRHEPDAELISALRATAAKKVGDAKACATVHSIINAYGVGRVFVGLAPGKSALLQPIVKHLQKKWLSLQKLSLDDAEGTAAAVDDLVDVIAACPGGQFRRSPCAASKLLCVLGLPVPIWDSLARKALGVQDGTSYVDFHSRWKGDAARGFQRHLPAYEAALDPLAPPQASSAAASLWRMLPPIYFCVRAHDVFLMGSA